jgi:hypothetical protein
MVPFYYDEGGFAVFDRCLENRIAVTIKSLLDQYPQKGAFRSADLMAAACPRPTSTAVPLSVWNACNVDFKAALKFAPTGASFQACKGATFGPAGVTKAWYIPVPISFTGPTVPAPVEFCMGKGAHAVFSKFAAPKMENGKVTWW